MRGVEICVLGVLVVGLQVPTYAASGAASGDGEPSAPTTEVIEVWGTRVRSNDHGLDDSDIEFRQADHISDLLRHLPGVDVGGAHSLNQRITIRSLGDRNLKISIDGATQNTYMYHHMGNLQIHADILKAVDVNVGHNSVVDAGLGGAVRFETRQASDLLRDDQRFGGRAQASWADNASESISLSAYGRVTDTLDALAYFNDVKRDNFEVGGGRIRAFNGSTVAGTDGKVRGLEGEVQDALVRLGWSPDDRHRVKLGYESYQDEGDYSYRPDMGLATGLAIAGNLRIPLLWPTEFNRDTVTLNYEFESDDGAMVRADAFFNDSTFRRDERGFAAVFPDSAVINEGEARNVGGNVLLEHTLGERHDLTWGLEYVRHDTTYTVDAIDLAGEESATVSLFVQDEIELGEYVSLIPGVRYDTVDVDAHVVEGNFDGFTAALAVVVQPVESTRIRVSAAQLFKAPELSEVFIGAGLFDRANPSLEEETGRNIELNIDYADAILGADGFSAGLTIFHTQIDDFVYEYAPLPVRFHRDNVGDLRIKGVEALLAYAIGPVTLSANYSRSRSDLDADAAYASLDGARIDREQGDTFVVAAEYVLEAFDLTFRYEILKVDDLGAALDLDGPTLDNAKDGFTIHTFSTQWLPGQVPGLALTLNVENLTDEFYASQSSRTGLSRHPRFGLLYLQDYEPGRNIKGTLSYRF